MDHLFNKRHTSHTRLFLVCIRCRSFWWNWPDRRGVLREGERTWNPIWTADSKLIVWIKHLALCQSGKRFHSSVIHLLCCQILCKLLCWFFVVVVCLLRLIMCCFEMLMVYCYYLQCLPFPIHFPFSLFLTHLSFWHALSFYDNTYTHIPTLTRLSRQVTRETNTQVKWPSKLKIGAKSKKGERKAHLVSVGNLGFQRWAIYENEPIPKNISGFNFFFFFNLQFK